MAARVRYGRRHAGKGLAAISAGRRAFSRAFLVTHRDAVDRQSPRLTSHEASVSDRPEADGEMLVDPPSRPPAELPRV
jgi:hypothetical protein